MVCVMVCLIGGFDGVCFECFVFRWFVFNIDPRDTLMYLASRFQILGQTVFQFFRVQALRQDPRIRMSKRTNPTQFAARLIDAFAAAWFSCPTALRLRHCLPNPFHRLQFDFLLKSRGISWASPWPTLLTETSGRSSKVITVVAKSSDQTHGYVLPIQSHVAIRLLVL